MVDVCQKQISCLCKVFSFYEELREEFLDETDEDTFFYHNNFDILQCQLRTVRVSNGSKKSLLQPSSSGFAKLGHSGIISFKKNLQYPKEDSVPWSTVCPTFSKPSIKLEKVNRFSYWSPSWHWSYKIKRQSLYSTLWSYLWAFR